MSINLLPDIRRPMPIKIVRIFNKENVIGAKLEVATLLRSNRNRVGLAVQRKACQHLLVPGRLRGNISHHILNRKLLQRQQHSRLMPEIGLVPLRIVRVIRELIAVLHPHWLLGKLPCRLQIVSMHPLRRNVVIRLQRRLLPGLSVFLHRLVPLVHDVRRAPARKHNGNRQKDLQLFLKLRINSHDPRKVSLKSGDRGRVGTGCVGTGASPVQAERSSAAAGDHGRLGFPIEYEQAHSSIRRSLFKIIVTLNAPQRKSMPIAQDDVLNALKQCYDPEIPVNIVDLGLIYEIRFDDVPEGQHDVTVNMTLTAQGCPEHVNISAQVKSRVEQLPGVRTANVNVIWEPAWTPERLSPEARNQLGIE